jgi:redox-sensitive bicupin YhaK (pirin superfamily)
MERIMTRSFRGAATMDGAGVRLTRIFGFGETAELDPFLLLDAFGSTREADYIKGFPWHPHRGIETVTYMLEGSVRHGDSMGNSGIIGPGELQWMTAGSGIVHEEMPQKSPRGVLGFQLWVNLPRDEKMRDPAYREAVASAVPLAPFAGGQAKVIAGSFLGARGPVSGIAREPMYIDIRLDPGGRVEVEAPGEETVFAFVYEGGIVRPSERPAGTCLLFSAGGGPGDAIALEAASSGARLILARARPLREPVAWRGPIVMNSVEELDLAFREYAAGTFVKRRA